MGIFENVTSELMLLFSECRAVTLSPAITTPDCIEIINTRGIGLIYSLERERLVKS